MQPDERERAVAAARSLGYELQVTEASAALTGRRLEVAVTITNRGVAPFYAGWPVSVVAVGAACGDVRIELPFQLNALLPGAAATCSGSLDLAKVSAGKVALLLGIPNPLKGGRPLRFANADQDRDRPGWLTLGTIQVP